MFMPVQLTNNWLGNRQLPSILHSWEQNQKCTRFCQQCSCETCEDCTCIVFDSAEEVATRENEPVFKYSCGSFVSCHQFQAVSSHAAKQPSQVTDLLHQLVRSNLLSSCCCYTGLQTVRAQTASFTQGITSSFQIKRQFRACDSSLL